MIKKTLTFAMLSTALTLIGSLSTLLLMSQTAHAAQLKVNISEVNQGKGHLLVGLYASEQDFNQGKAILGSRIKAEEALEQVVFNDVPAGEYAIKIYQDENSNQKLDFNFMGIPKEGYGYSNNVGRFGAPAFNEAVFTIDNKTEIAIELF